MILLGRKKIPPPRQILIIQPRRIGDVLLTTPSIRALSRHFPECKIDFLVESPADECLWGHPLLDRLLVIERGGSVKEFFSSVRLLRQKSYDWALDFFSNPRSAQFTFFSGARVRVGLDRRGRRWAYTHRIIEEQPDKASYAVDLRLEILHLLGVAPAGRELEIYSDSLDPSEKARVDSVLGTLKREKLVAVATGSANPAKRYPADLTAEVIKALQSEGLTVVLTSGPGETPLAEEILKDLPKEIPFLAGARVPTLAALYRRVRLYIGPDSGPKHIAVACGIPTVTVFGPGQPSNWNDTQNLKNVVLAAPCEIRPHCIESECAQRQCLRKILPSQVVRAALDLMASGSSPTPWGKLEGGV